MRIIDLTRKILTESPLSLNEIAKRSKVKKSTIYTWVCGKVENATIDNLSAVLAVCGYNIVIARKE